MKKIWILVVWREGMMWVMVMLIIGGFLRSLLLIWKFYHINHSTMYKRSSQKLIANKSSKKKITKSKHLLIIFHLFPLFLILATNIPNFPIFLFLCHNFPFTNFIPLINFHPFIFPPFFLLLLIQYLILINSINKIRFDIDIYFISIQILSS